MKKENKSFLKECLIILFVGIIVNAACFFLCSITGHCENEVYPVSSGVNAPLGAFTEQEILEFCNNYSAIPYDYYYVIRVTANPNNVYPLNARYDVCVFNKSLYDPNSLGRFPLYTEVSNSGYFQFHLNSLYNNDLYNVKFYHLQSYAGNSSDLNIYSGSVNDLSANSPLIDDKTTYYFNISVPKDYVTNTEYVLKYTESINPGDFSDLPEIDEILDDITNSYTFDPSPVFPNIDNNKTDIENQKSFFETLGNSITSSLNNLGNSLKTWFNNLMSKMVQGFNSVSQNIHNGFATLMSNIQNFFGPKLDFIIEKLEYLTRPFDIETFTSDLNNSTFASSLLGLITSVQSFSNNFTSATEPSSCSFTLDFTNAYYNFGVCTFSLDWILPVRPIIRLILGCLCLYSLVISIFTSINTYIGGTSSINDDI